MATQNNSKNNQVQAMEQERRTNNGTAAILCILILTGFGLIYSAFGLDWLKDIAVWFTTFNMEEGSAEYIAREASVGTVIGYTKFAVFSLAGIIGYLSARNNMS